MKRIEAVIRHDKLPEVRTALAAIPSRALTISDMREQDATSSLMLHYRGTSQAFDLVPRVGVSLLVDDADAGDAVRAIAAAAHTGREGDGSVTVLPVDEIVMISTAGAVA